MTDVEARLGVGESGEHDQLYLGDAIDFFLNSKRAGGRSEKTIGDYLKKLGESYGRCHTPQTSAFAPTSA